MASGELAGLLRSLKATLKLGPGNTKLVADALRHGLGSWPELASSGDGARAVCRPAKWGGRTALPFSGYPTNSHAPAIRGCRSSARGLPAVPNMPGTCPCSLPAVAAHATAASHSNRFAEPKATAILPRKPTGFGRAGAVCLARGAAARPLANRRNPRPRRSRVLRLISLEFLKINCRICQVLSEHRDSRPGSD